MDEYEKAGADRAVDLLIQNKQLRAENERLKEENHNRLKIIEEAGWALGIKYPSENRECIVLRIDKLKARDIRRIADFNALLQLFNNLYEDLEQALKGEK